MAGNVFSGGKAALRLEAESRRRALSAEVVNRWGGEVQRHLAALPLFGQGRGQVVAVYDAQPFEVPLAQFIAVLESRGALPVFPRVVKGSRELTFHEGGAWVAGPLGLRQPAPEAPRHELEQIDVFIVPGVCFTRDGRRMGRGGGYYDASLARRKPKARLIGVTFELNVVPEIPTEAHDQRVDSVATEAGVFDAR
ncbi:MAG: 5-formyltetrahydrofolate cyclo-ligase [Archangium sp.]